MLSEMLVSFGFADYERKERKYLLQSIEEDDLQKKVIRISIIFLALK